MDNLVADLLGFEEGEIQLDQSTAISLDEAVTLGAEMATMEHEVSAYIRTTESLSAQADAMSKVVASFEEGGLSPESKKALAESLTIVAAANNLPENFFGTEEGVVDSTKKFIQSTLKSIQIFIQRMVMYVKKWSAKALLWVSASDETRKDLAKKVGELKGDKEVEVPESWFSKTPRGKVVTLLTDFSSEFVNSKLHEVGATAYENVGKAISTGKEVYSKQVAEAMSNIDAKELESSNFELVSGNSNVLNEKYVSCVATYGVKGKVSVLVFHADNDGDDTPLKTTILEYRFAGSDKFKAGKQKVSDLDIDVKFLASVLVTKKDDIKKSVDAFVKNSGTIQKSATEALKNVEDKSVVVATKGNIININKIYSTMIFSPVTLLREATQLAKLVTKD